MYVVYKYELFYDTTEKSPEAVVTGSCDLPCGCWKPNVGLLEVLLPAEFYFQPLELIFLEIESLPIYSPVAS